jgi:TolB protein
VKPGHDVWATNVYLMNADGSGVRPLTRTAWSDHPVWSPDSRRIVFLRHGTKLPGNDVGSTVSDIYVVNVDGKGLRRLTHSPSEEYALAWSTRNRIAFVRDSLKGQMPKGEIFTMRPDGSGERRLTHTRDGESGLAWSPSGHKLLFVRWLNSRDLPSIFVMDADGTNQRRLLEPGRSYDYYNWPDIGPPAWSPDGSRITFIGGSAAAKGANQAIYVMQARGAALHKVGGTDSQSPSWAPDSRTIAFVQHPAIYLVNASGSDQRRLIPRPGRPAFSLHENWTPVWARRALR